MKDRVQDETDSQELGEEELTELLNRGRGFTLVFPCLFCAREARISVKPLGRGMQKLGAWHDRPMCEAFIEAPDAAAFFFACKRARQEQLRVETN